MIKTFNIREEIEKEVVRFGNGSIVYTPKKWIGKKVSVILEEKPLDIEGEVMEMLKPYFSGIQGIFLYGSFARKEQTENSDVDLLVISDKKIGLKRKGRFDFLVKTKEEFTEALKKDSNLFLHQILQEAKPVFNTPLLEEIKKTETKPDLKEFFEDTLSAFKKSKELIDAHKKNNKKYLDSNVVIYSLILRLRTLFLIQSFKKNKDYSNKRFKESIKKRGFKEKTVESFLGVYRSERDGKKATQKILLSDVEKLFELAKKEFLETEEMVKS
ncbi:DUF2080 family transposase-associated protein [Candidatus Micrarchaeota archaeon]|nr:DUF2080 family transposase-associated protein [Candidatus Micrarchaeota archaeon]MBU2477386.1 DUF2080 family transposase-associated protein [Candidatus Micrarchaeota archaeon]